MGKKNYLIVSVLLVLILANSVMLFAQRVIDLDKVWGDIQVSSKGSAIAHGDINGDGYMDIIIGAGVILGSSNPPNTESYDMVISGVKVDDGCGHAVACGDINGDGYDDIIIGAPYADPPGGEDAGETYVIFGSSSPPSNIYLSTQSADITVYGVDANDRSGFAVARGDINGDGYDDLIIGAYLADPPGGESAGETYVIFGSSLPSPPYIIDLATQSANICVYGDDYQDYSSRAVASGDVNNDGCDDIIIGAYGADPPGGNNAGETYVILGSSTIASLIIDLNSQSADITICGDDIGDESGEAVASGDINADGYDDIIIGARYAKPPGGLEWAGETYIIFGFGFPAPSYTIDLNYQLADITVYGENYHDWCGNAVASGDINGDGYDDIIIGAYSASITYHYDVGKVYVVFGFNSAYPDIIDLSHQSAGITIIGDDAGDQLGWAVGSGDINGDGYEEIISSSYGAATYIISGGGAIIAARGIGGTVYGYVESFSILGRKWGKFRAFAEGNSQGEIHLAVGDLDWDGLDEIAAGHGEGGTSLVRVLKMDGSRMLSFKAFGAANSGGEVHLTMGNFAAGPLEKEIAVAHGEGGKSWVKVFNAYGTFIRNFKAFGGANVQGEVHLAAGDLENDDGIDEIIAGMGEGGSCWVKILSHEGTLLRKFKAFGSVGNPGGEVHLAVGNFDADPDLEIAVATGYSGSNRVKLFENDGSFISKFTAFGVGDNPNGEVQITAADIDNDGIWEIICGHGEGGSSQVKLFKADGTFIRAFIAFDTQNPLGEVHLAKANY